MKAKLTYQPYADDVYRLAQNNTDFRRVLSTTERSQLVLMAIPPGGEIGIETHEDTDQILAFVEGTGHATLAGMRRPVRPGDVVVIPAGTQHNFVADAGQALKLYTVYAPPHHRPGTVHKTKADADADTADTY